MNDKHKNVTHYPKWENWVMVQMCPKLSCIASAWLSNCFITKISAMKIIKAKDPIELMKLCHLQGLAHNKRTAYKVSHN